MLKNILARPILWFSLVVLLVLGWCGTRLAIGAVIEEGDQELLISKRGNITIIENLGQYDDQAQYIIRHGKGTTWLAEDSLWLTLYDDPEEEYRWEPGSTRPDDAIITGLNLKISFPGIQRLPSPQANFRRSTRVSYLIGQDAGQWHADVPVWAEARYSGLFPGVDLVFDDRGATSVGSILPWRLESMSGQVINEVVLRLEGAERVEVSDDGLILWVSDHSYELPLFSLNDPTNSEDFTYMVDMPAVDVNRQGSGDFMVSFPLSPIGEMEPSAPADDPNDLIFSTYLGGSSWDSAFDVAVDEDGFSYVVGRTASSNFPTTPGAFDETLSVIDAFVTKFTTDGTGLVYSTFIGGSHIEEGFGIDVENGIAYITGQTSSLDFPLNTGTEGDSDVYVVALNSTGSALNYSTLVGGRNDDIGYAIDVEGGVAAVTGKTDSNNFPGGGYEKDWDTFIIRMNPSGGLANSRLLGGIYADVASGIAVESGYTYITGNTESPDFPGGGFSGEYDVFVAKLDPSFNLDFTLLLGGGDIDRGRAIDVDGSGYIYVTGYTRSSGFPVTEGSLVGDADVFVVKLNGSGAMEFGTFIGGTNWDEGLGLELDWLSGLNITGFTKSSDYPITEGAFDTSHNGLADGFITRMDLSPSALVTTTYSTYFGGSDDDQGNAIAINDFGEATMTGEVFSSDFPVSPGAYDSTLDGTWDSFVTRIQAIQLPAIDIEKSTNDIGADDPPGPYLTVGVPITWEYIVTNRGDFTLSNIEVTDDHEDAICQQSTLIPHDSLSCNAFSTAQEGQYANVGTASGTPEGGGDAISDVDTSHYFGAIPNITMDKFTQGYDADDPPGPVLRAGEIMTWTYIVTNTGNVILNSVIVTDDIEGPAICPFDTLLTGQPMTCVITDTVTVGQYSNQGDVEGTPPGGLAPVSASDSSHYFGADPSLTIQKLSNGVDVEGTPGPLILVGETVSWTYLVTNTGNYTISDISVIDDQGVFVTCPTSELGLASSISCTASDLAVAGQYTNTATVTGTVPAGPDVSAQDISHYFGVQPNIEIQKLTNDLTADSTPGPFIVVGDTVTWTYLLTNTGNITLSNVTLSDSMVESVFCPGTDLGLSETMLCEAHGTAVSGQYTNTGLVTASTPIGVVISSTDVSHYFGSDPAVTIEKSTNGWDADQMPGPHLLVGDTVTWTYIVTNSGNVTLTDILATDDKSVSVFCPEVELAVGESMACLANDLVESGQYTNTGTVVGTPPVGADVFDEDHSHYFGSNPDISLEKRTNGEDADSPPGPFIEAGNPVTWTYIVTNSGDVNLDGISVTDDQGVTVSCDSTSLTPGESTTCQGIGVAITGQYTNTATATGYPPDGLPVVTAIDASHYFGSAPDISIRKLTLDENANEIPGPFIIVGDPVTWTYIITNTGNVTLTSILLTDNQEGNIDCPEASLAAGESMSCWHVGTALSDQYVNMGTASGSPPIGDDVSAQDISHYFGIQHTISLQKLTMEEDADDPPGPYVVAGTNVTWTFLVTNSSNYTVSSIVVTDNEIGVVTCPQDVLGAGMTMRCDGYGVAQVGQYTNTGTVTADLPVEPEVSATDDSHYFGVDAHLDLSKTTNGQDAETIPGPFIEVGGAVTWTYIVTNSSNITVTNVTVTDSHEAPVDCPTSVLGSGETMVCEAFGTAVAGQYSNTGFAVASPPAGEPISDSYLSHYFGSDPAVTIEKSTNGLDADQMPGPHLLVGDTVTWTYIVTNSGNVTLTDILATDDKSVSVFCPMVELAVGESMTCLANDLVESGQYTNTGTVVGTPPVGVDVFDDDHSHYYGSSPSISLEKRTNGEDADNPPGPFIEAGNPVTWTYIITNSGDVNLDGISVTDDQSVIVTCDSMSLTPGESATCQGTGDAISGQYTNTATAFGHPPDELPAVTAIDASHYFGSAPDISVNKLTRGQDAGVSPGPYIVAGDPVSWTYIITNTGNVTLTSITLNDDQEGSISCSVNQLAVGEEMVCEHIGISTSGQYTNTATAWGKPPVGSNVSANDISHYFGVLPEIEIQKLTQGQDADNAPGPYVEIEDLVIWTYMISNTGDIKLINIDVSDSEGAAVSCTKDFLEVGETMACSATDLAASGQYGNLGTVTANPLENTNVISDTDPSHYFGAELELLIEKFTNGLDADATPGVLILAGDPVTWTYHVTNTSNVTLTSITVTDDQSASVSCPHSALGLGEGMICLAQGTATSGQYGNIGTATGLPPGDLLPIAQSDPSHYFGVEPNIDLEKHTQGADADSAPGPYIVAGEIVSWTYHITNTGNYTLTDVILSDNQLGAIACPKTVLGVDETMSCVETDAASEGQYSNLGSVSAGHPVGLGVSDIDSSHYFGISPAITIEKLTNGQDADAAPGPTIYVGHPVTWTYIVTNTGNITLTGVVVVDDQGADVECPASILSVNERMTCTALGTAMAGQYANIGTATGTPPAGPDASDIDPSHYFGFTIEPSIDIQNFTNGVDADNPPGPYVPIGQAITWTYSIANSGNITLTDIQVTDDQLGTISCPVTVLGVTQSMVCTEFGISTSGQYTNAGFVSALDFTGVKIVTDTDSSHYFGTNPSISIEKRTNGQSADQAPGPYIEVGDFVDWSYHVTNTGNISLTGVIVTDDKGAEVTCPLDTLSPGQPMTCTASDVADAGQYSNTATVVGDPPVDDSVSAQNTSHYYGAVLDLGIEKLTNGEDADGMPGPLIPVGLLVTWTYEVSNGSNVTLTNISVSDDRSVPVSCPQGTLAPLESMTCTAAGIAESGQYTNTGTVIGTPPGGLSTLENIDTSHYYGSAPSIIIEKQTNGLDADSPPGPFFELGNPILWEYVITNTGNVELTAIAVIDDQGVSVTCPGSTLQAGDSMICTADGSATDGQYANTGVVTASPEVGGEVGHQDSSHYFGSNPGIEFNKYTNGEDADSQPGPTILATLPITWTYVISNTGNVTFTGVTVDDDDPGVEPNCPSTELAPETSMTCTAYGFATAGQYANLGTVTGIPPVGAAVIESDPSHYYSFVAEPAISIEKTTNGERADEAPGPYIPIGDPVEWNYLVTNPGNVTIENIVVDDSDPSLSISCPQDFLVSGDSMTCSASGLSVAGQYSNTGTVSGKPPLGASVEDDDSSHYFGSDPGIMIKKFTNGQDASSSKGPIILIGDPVLWNYVVTNTGNVTLTSVTVVDDQDVDIVCDLSVLGPDDSMTCTATGISEAGQYQNIGTVSGNPPVGAQVEDSDVSHYFGSNPGIEIQKYTNGEDADDPPGPYILVGQPVNWNYVVTNTGNITLNNVTVADDHLGVITCPDNTLAPGESMVCTDTEQATAGPYANIGYVDTDEQVSNSDSSHYNGYSLDPAVDIKKFTNGQDANLAPGPLIPAGMTVTWAYTVTNAGADPLLDITVIDDDLGAVDCPADTLATNESMVCTMTGVAVEGQYSNLGTVFALGLTSGEVVSDSDIGHYFGSLPDLSIKKLTNGVDVDTVPGPYIEVGNPVTWTYIITNSGNVKLADVTVNDDQGETVDCPEVTLEPGQPMTCYAYGIASNGQYTNTGTVSGTPPVGDVEPANDTSHYFGAVLDLAVEKFTNGENADAAPGPLILTGDSVTWTYVITNLSNVDLYDIEVTDDQGVLVSCPLTALLPGSDMTCTAVGIAMNGQYTNTANVSGHPVGLPPITASDPSHYFGVDPEITIEKYTNAQDADLPPGPYLEVGVTVSWTYRITNSGNITLSNVSVIDDQGIPVSCPKSDLGPGTAMTCTASGLSSAGQYVNTGRATGTPAIGPEVSDTDASHYFGVAPAIDIEKHTNGEDADVAPGPFLEVGVTVGWTYQIINSGNITLSSVSVIDDQGVSITCPETNLGPGAAMTCTAYGLTDAGQYANTGRVTGTPAIGPDVTDTDASHYFGVVPAIDIEKYTNAQDADLPPGPFLEVGVTVNWTYRVTNGGNITLSNVSVIDDQGITVSCPESDLGPGAAMTCTAIGLTDAGQYVNTGRATGTPAIGPNVTDTDASHYFGVVPALVLQKHTNGEDADTLPGPIIVKGELVFWEFVVTNGGNARLTNINVSDDQEEHVVCPKSVLEPRESMICTASSVAVVGEYSNLGTAEGLPPAGSPVIANDPSHYTGELGISLVFLPVIIGE